MSKTPEEMAEEWAHDWRYEGVCAYGRGNLELSPFAQKEIKYRLGKAFLAGYKAAQAIVEEELQAVQAQREERPGLGSAEYALKSVLAKMGANENT